MAILPDLQLFPPEWLRMTWNGQFRPICNFSNLFPPKCLRMTQNGQFCPICNFSNLFPPEWLRMTWNGQFRLICNFSNLFPPEWLRMTWNGQFHPIHNFSNLFPLKYLRMTWNGQFLPICNFSNLFPPKWLRMTWNGQFCPICNFSNLFPLLYMSCISKTTCILVNCAPLSLQFGRNEEPKGSNGSRPSECDYQTPPSKSDTAPFWHAKPQPIRGFPAIEPVSSDVDNEHDITLHIKVSASVRLWHFILGLGSEHLFGS